MTAKQISYISFHFILFSIFVLSFTPIGKLNCRIPHYSADDVKVPLPGETLFISYKTSLYEYCQNCGWHPPVYITRQSGSGWTSKASFGGHVYFSKEFKRFHQFKSPKQIIEQKAAHTALVGIGVMNSKIKFNIDGTIHFCSLSLLLLWFT